MSSFGEAELPSIVSFAPPLLYLVVWASPYLTVSAPSNTAVRYRLACTTE